MAETAIRKQLLESFLEQGIQDTNFFNGRLLTAGDLVTLQEASRSRDRQLGLGIGAGVVQGLEVRLLSNGSDGNPPVLAVSKGLAFNRVGQAVALGQDAEVRLAKDQPAESSSGKPAFDVCLPIQNGQPLPGKGAYVFAARPASGYQGQAPRRGLGQAAKVEGCDRDLLQEGAQFRLVPLDVTSLDKLAKATRDTLAQLLKDADKSGAAGLQAQHKLRNRLAHVCFGTEELAAWRRDPFARTADEFSGAAVHSPYATYGAVDELRGQALLDDCDVPLAVVCWTQTGIKWVDMWAVRRRIVRLPVGDPWSLLLDERRAAESEAMLLQFQRQLEEMLAEPSRKSVTAASRFQYLPPAGYLPVDTAEFDKEKFFQGLAVTSEEMDPAFVRLLIWRSLYLDPIDLADPAPLRVFYHEDAPGYVVFVRDESQPAAQPEPAAEDARKPGADPKSGRVVIDVSIQPDEGARGKPFLKKSEKRDAARQTLNATVSDKNASPHDTLADSSAVDVYAQDRRGHTYPAVHVSRYSFGDDSKRNVITFSSDVARFVINSLSPGTYTVYARVLGYKLASQEVKVIAGKTTPVTFALVPEDDQEDHKPKKQPGPVDAVWIPPYYWYGRLYPVESYVRWPWPPDPKVARQFGPVVGPPPPDVDIWIEQWVDYLQAQYPAVALDPGEVQLLIDKSHTPDKIASEPYAYLTFGESGPYLPVVLTSKDMVLDRSVSLAKAGLRGVDADMASWPCQCRSSYVSKH